MMLVGLGQSNEQGLINQAKSSFLDSGSGAYIVGRKDFPTLASAAERDGFRLDRRRRSRLVVTGSASVVGTVTLADCHCVGKP